ncbi:MAG: hypothetical protein U0Y10_10835 [Spirosomataceae bacterium]
MSNQNNDEIERLFRERFVNYESNPPADALLRILNKVNQPDDMPSQDAMEHQFQERFANFEAEPPVGALKAILAEVNKPVRVFAFSYRYAAALALLLLSLASVAWFTVQQGVLSTTNQTSQAQTQPTQQSQPTGTDASTVLESTTQTPATSRPLSAIESPQPNAIVQTLPSTSESSSLAEPQPPTTEITEEKATVSALKTAKAVVNPSLVTSKSAKPSAFYSAEKQASSTPTTEIASVPELKGQLLKADKEQTITLRSTTRKRSLDRQSLSQSFNKEAATTVTRTATNIASVSPVTSIPTEVTTTLSPVESSSAAFTFASLQTAMAKSKGFRPSIFNSLMPAVQSVKTEQAWIKIAKPHKILDMYVSMMPLYNYYSIAPQHSDDVLVEDVRTTSNFSSQRAGWRFQLGTEIPVSQRFKLRLGLSYLQMNHYVSYRVRNVLPDSMATQLLNSQTLALTPIYYPRTRVSDTQWHYAGVKADLLFKLNQSGAMAHYLSVGTEGVMQLDQNGNSNMFLNFAYGVNYPLGQGINLRVEPTLNYGLRSATDDYGNLALRPVNVGLNFGLVWQLK